MTTQLEQAARLALEAGCNCTPDGHAAMEALRAALEQPAQDVSYTGNGTAGREADASPTGFFFQMPKAAQDDVEQSSTQSKETFDQPVAWMDGYRNIYSLEEKAAGCEDAVIPLYSHPMQHWSDCAVHNAPAYPSGKCDCGGYTRPANSLNSTESSKMLDAQAREPFTLSVVREKARLKIQEGHSYRGCWDKTTEMLFQVCESHFMDGFRSAEAAHGIGDNNGTR